MYSERLKYDTKTRIPSNLYNTRARSKLPIVHTTSGKQSGLSMEHGHIQGLRGVIKKEEAPRYHTGRSKPNATYIRTGHTRRRGSSLVLARPRSPPASKESRPQVGECRTRTAKPKSNEPKDTSKVIEAVSYGTKRESRSSATYPPS